MSKHIIALLLVFLLFAAPASATVLDAGYEDETYEQPSVTEQVTEQENQTVEVEEIVETEPSEDADAIVEVGEVIQEEGMPTTTPDETFLWGFKRIGEKISYMFSFTKSAKTRKLLEHARERLLEAQLMVEQKKFDDAEKSAKIHDDITRKMSDLVSGLDDNMEGLQKSAEINKGLKAQEARITSVIKDAKSKVEFTDSEKDLFDLVFDRFSNANLFAKKSSETKMKRAKAKLKDLGIVVDVKIDSEEEEKKEIVVEEPEEEPEVEAEPEEVEEEEETIEEEEEEEDDGSDASSDYDLAIDKVLISTLYPDVGERFEIKLYVKNEGTEKFETFNYRIKITTEAGSSVESDSQTYPSNLVTGDTVKITKDYSIDSAGTYKINIKLDPNNNISEKDESNNEYEKTVVIS